MNTNKKHCMEMDYEKQTVCKIGTKKNHEIQKELQNSVEGGGFGKAIG
jgi:hypothetical protein